MSSTAQSEPTTEVVLNRTDLSPTVTNPVPDTSLPGECRRRAYTAALGWGLAGIADDLVLLVSELVTNAAQHGGGCHSFRMYRTASGIRVEVRQCSSGLPRVRHPGAHQERGRGLLLVELLADAWGAEPDGRTAWFTLTAPEES